MNNINWDLAPEGAVELRELKSGVCLRWFNKQGEYFSGSGWEFSTSDYNVIATRPTQTKTVADAVEVFGTKWPSSRYNFAWWDSDTEQMLLGCNETSDTVCTRAEFEAYVNASKIGKILESSDEKEGEKWTHVVDDDEGQLTKCRKHLKLCNGSDWVYVCEKGEYFVPSKMGYCGVKPIKPTISKAQAWDKLMQNKMNSAEVNTIKQQYDIVEVPAND